MKTAINQLVLILSLSCCLASVADTKPPDVSFADSSPSTITLQPNTKDKSQTEALFTPVMRNSGGTAASLCFSFQVLDDKNTPAKILLSDASGAERICFPDRPILGWQVHSYPLKIKLNNTTRALSGFLVAEVCPDPLQAASPCQDATRTAVVPKPVRLVPPIKPNFSGYLFAIPFAVAVGCILLATCLVAKFDLRSRMGSGSWDFSQSWASNITVAGAVVTTLLGFSGLPEYGVYLSKNAYFAISTLFTALVMLAPPVYNFTRRSFAVPIPDPDDPTNSSGSRLEGAVLGFLAASFVTLWAVFAQLFTIALLLRELVEAGPMPSNTGTAFQTLIVVISALLVMYSNVTIYYTVKKQVAHHTRTLELRVTAASAATQASVATQKPPLPKWALL